MLTAADFREVGLILFVGRMKFATLEPLLMGQWPFNLSHPLFLSPTLSLSRSQDMTEILSAGTLNLNSIKPVLINWTSPFPIYGLFSAIFCIQFLRRQLVSKQCKP